MQPVDTPIGKLKPYPNNAKLHPDSQIAKIIESIKLTGFDQPIVTDTDHVIIKGHGRFMAAKQMGLKTVPVIVLDVPPEVAKAARIADNKSAESGFDMELLIQELRDIESQIDLTVTGFDLEELGDLFERQSRLLNDAVSSTFAQGPAYGNVGESPSQGPVSEYPSQDPSVWVEGRAGHYVNPTADDYGETNASNLVVTSDDVRKAESSIDSQFNQKLQKEAEAIICPHCGGEFLYG